MLACDHKFWTENSKVESIKEFSSEKMWCDKVASGTIVYIDVLNYCTIINVDCGAHTICHDLTPPTQRNWVTCWTLHDFKIQYIYSY